MAVRLHERAAVPAPVNVTVPQQLTCPQEVERLLIRQRPQARPLWLHHKGPAQQQDSFEGQRCSERCLRFACRHCACDVCPHSRSHRPPVWPQLLCCTHLAGCLQHALDLVQRDDDVLQAVVHHALGLWRRGGQIMQGLGVLRHLAERGRFCTTAFVAVAVMPTIS